MTISETVTYEIIDLGCCGQHIGLPVNQVKALRKSGRGFWCPGCGSSRCYTSEETRDKKRITQLEQQVKQVEESRVAALARENRTRRSLIAEKGHRTRLKKRIAHGVCPCCKRTFKQLQRHMTNKHPEYVPPAGELV